jgi:hypothetical protein
VFRTGWVFNGSIRGLLRFGIGLCISLARINKIRGRIIF